MTCAWVPVVSYLVPPSQPPDSFRAPETNLASLRKVYHGSRGRAFGCYTKSVRPRLGPLLLLPSLNSSVSALHHSPSDDCSSACISRDSMDEEPPRKKLRKGTKSCIECSFYFSIRSRSRTRRAPPREIHRPFLLRGVTDYTRSSP